MLRATVSALLLWVLLAAPARGQEPVAVDLPQGLQARLTGPGELELRQGGESLLRVRLALLREDGGLRRLDPEVLGPGRPAAAPLPDRPTVTAGQEIITRALDWGAGDDRRRLRTELYHWPWFHVEGAAFLVARLEGPEAGRPVALVEGPEGWERRNLSLFLHGGLGPDARRGREVGWVRTEDATGAPLHLALLPLVGGSMEGPDRVRWPATEPRRWVLALVAAPSEAALRRALGQAWATQDFTSKNPDGSVSVLGLPPLCQRCRAAAAASARLDLGLGEEETLEARLRLRDLDGHGVLDGEAARVAGVPLGPWLVETRRGEAVYRLPLDHPVARRLQEAAAAGTVAVRLRLDTGILLDLEEAAAHAGPALAEHWAKEEARELLPGHLAFHLLESWPNPFQDETTILYRVPATVGEAFDFAQGPPRGLELGAPPPFGTEPVVRVKIYSVSGKLVRLLSEEAHGPGEYQVRWDGTDPAGRPVAAGAYYVLVEMGDYQVTRRVLRLRS
jgi:hypothetical protein